jgi:hypothetical protein
VSPTSAIVS